MLVHEGNTGRIAPSEEGATASSSVFTGRETMVADLGVVANPIISHIREISGVMYSETSIPLNEL